MPYIKTCDRPRLDEAISLMPFTLGPGDLAYTFYRLALRYIGQGVSFARFATVIGVSVCVVLELYRRVIAPYEETKMRENLDVWA